MQRRGVRWQHEMASDQHRQQELQSSLLSAGLSRPSTPPPGTPSTKAVLRSIDCLESTILKLHETLILLRTL